MDFKNLCEFMKYLYPKISNGHYQHVISDDIMSKESELNVESYDRSQIDVSDIYI